MLQEIEPVVFVNHALRVVGWLTLSDLSRRLLLDSEIVQNGLKDLTDT